jgi:hypothetical protein
VVVVETDVATEATVVGKELVGIISVEETGVVFIVVPALVVVDETGAVV